MHAPIRAHARTLSVAAAALAAAALAAPAANYGRATSPHEVVQTTLAPEGDSDAFVFQGAPGFRVKAKGKRARGATVIPVIDLLAPDGSAVVDGVVSRSGGAAASLSATLADSGLHALRLGGSAGTGGVTFSWSLKPAKVPALRLDPLAGDEQKEYAFSARGGATVSWSLSFRGDGAAQVIRVLDPNGIEVPYDPEDPTYVIRRITSEKIKKLPIPADRPGGIYKLVVFNDLNPVTVNLSIRVALPRIPKLTVALTPADPVLLSIDRIVGGCGSPVVATGQNLSEAPQAILFGGVPATAVVVQGGSDLVPNDATTASCDAPAGTGPVDFVFIAQDGQVAVLSQAFTFDPLPTVLSFDPNQGPGQGGVELTLDGTGFQSEGQNLYEVLVGGVPASQVVVVDENTITCRTPAHVAGPKSVVLRDRCGQTVTAPGTFTYGTGLFITTIRPDAVPAFGGVPVVINGSNLSAGDTVYLDNVPIATTPVLFGATVIGHRIDGADLAPHAPGTVDVKVTSPGGAQSTKLDGLAYYTFSDTTSTSIPAASATDDWGGIGNVLIDKDSDGTADWIVIAHTDALSATRPGIRLLVNDGSGVFTDGTDEQMPDPTETEGFGATHILAGRLNADIIPDLFLGRHGTGVDWDMDGDGNPDWIESRMKNNKEIDPWARLVFPNASGVFVNQTVTGLGALLGITGQRFCDATWACAGVERPNICMLFDFDFRSDAGVIGDLDGDSDGDVVLLNERSLATFSGSAAGIWVGCYYGLVNYQYYSAKGYGSAMRILTASSNGGLTDRTKYLVETLPTLEEDFRAVAGAIADLDGDFLNDIVIVHNETVTSKAGAPVSAARFFKQKNSGTSVVYRKINTFFPAPVNAGDDDWRGDAVAVVDLNTDFYRDVVISINGDPVAGAYSTRVLMHDTSLAKGVDRTAEVLGPALVEGDDGRAKVIVARDFDRDGDVDLLLSTPDDIGSGLRRTRLFLNVDKDPATGLPILIDASSLFPDAAADAGNAVAVAVGDIDGDRHLDFVLTDTHETEGTPVKRTRVWKQVR